MVENLAAWITEKHGKPLKVDHAPRPKAGTGEVVIKNAAVAVNPVDWKIQYQGLYLEQYPYILGADAAGVIEEVGEGVTRLWKGQRVVGLCHGLASGSFANSAFQLYTSCAEILVSPIPDSLSFEQAVVLPGAVSTAAAGLYQKSHLSLPLPTLNTTSTGKTILVWGGASSVGATAVQLATASGLKVVSTASRHNHDLVKSLGASTVIDYNSASAVDDLVAALKSVDFAGVYDAISTPSSLEQIGAILDKVGPSKVATTLPPPDNLTTSVQSVDVFAFSIANDPNKDIGDYIWRKFVPEALASGQLKAKPDPLVVGTGLSKIQDGLEKQKAGVSAKKVVVSL